MFLLCPLVNNFSLYRCNRNYVHTENSESEEFITRDGLRQGGVECLDILFDSDGQYNKGSKIKNNKLIVGNRNMKVVELTE